MFSQVKSVIFDMDGVIVDTEPLHYKSYTDFFKKEFNMSIGEVYLKTVGMTDKETFEFLKKRFHVSVDTGDLVRKREIAFRKLLEKRVTPMPNSLEAITELRKLFPLALASSSKADHIEIVLNKLGIEDAFKVIVSGDEVKKGKPDPEIYLLTAERLRLPPRECLAIEDSEFGVNAAKSAGMTCIAIPNELTKNHDFSRADRIVNNLREVYTHLKSAS